MVKSSCRGASSVFQGNFKELGGFFKFFNPIQGGGQKRFRASSSLNFDKNNHRMRL